MDGENDMYGLTPREADSRDRNTKREAFSDQQLFLPSGSGKDVRSSVKKATFSLPRLAGRFRVPLGGMDRLRTNLEQSIVRLSGIEPGIVIDDPFYPVPPEWQAIFNFLYRRGFTTNPRVVSEPSFNDTPMIYLLRLFSKFERAPTDGNTVNLSGHSRGVSGDFEEALSKVLGEFLERYPLMMYRRRNLTRGSPRSLQESKKPFLNIQDLAGFADWQKEFFPERRFSDESNFCWVEGKELTDRRPTLIPAQLIFWNYNTREESHEPYLRQPITNGAAGGFTREEAIIAAIYESVQRDSFLVHWLNSIPPPTIEIESIEDTAVKKMVECLGRYQFDVIFLNTTTDLFVPSCACVLVDRSEAGPKIAVGGGCDFNWNRALLHSLHEAIGVYHWLRGKMKEALFHFDDGHYIPFRDRAIDQAERLLIWGDSKFFPRIKPFLSGTTQSFTELQGKTPHFKDSNKELHFLIDLFRKKGRGYEIYLYEARHDLLDTFQYHSVRVVIPSLVPLYLREIDAPLGAKRIAEFASYVGRPAKEVNPWPHPFP